MADVDPELARNRRLIARQERLARAGLLRPVEVPAHVTSLARIAPAAPPKLGHVEFARTADGRWAMALHGRLAAVGLTLDEVCAVVRGETAPEELAQQFIDRPAGLRGTLFGEQ